MPARTYRNPFGTGGEHGAKKRESFILKKRTMKRYLINALAVLLILFPLYWAISSVPIILQTFDPSQIGITVIILFISLAYTLSAVAGIGLLLKKNWAIVLYWVAIVLFAFVTFIYMPITPLINGYLFLFLNVIVASFISTQWKKLGLR